MTTKEPPGVFEYVENTMLAQVRQAFARNCSVKPYGVVFVPGEKTTVPLVAGAFGMDTKQAKEATRNLAKNHNSVAVAFVDQVEVQRPGLSIPVEVVMITVESPDHDRVWFANVGASKMGDWHSTTREDCEYEVKRTAFLPQRWMN